MCLLCGRIEDRHAITAADLAVLAKASGGKPVLSESEVIERLHYETGSWPPGSNLDFGFYIQRPSFFTGSNYTGFNAMGEAQKSTVRTALSLWSDVARIKFHEVADASTITYGLAFANSSSIDDDVWGFAFSSGTVRSVWVNHNDATESWYGETAGSFDLTATLHEIGHTLSLSHPGDYNASDSGDDLNYQSDAEYQQDSRQFTVMSYFDASNTGGSHGRSFASTPLLHDLLAVQYLYGRNYNTRSGDTVYGFNSTADQNVLDLTKNRQAIVTIWDGGGHNVLDLSGYTTASDIDLRSASFSSFAGLTYNLSIAFGTYIHDAVAGGGADKLQDNALSNRLSAGDGDDVIRADKGGNDTIDGGNGTDTLHLFGKADEYWVQRNTDGSLKLFGPTGSLLVNNVEQFRFEGGGAAATALSVADILAMNFNASLYLASNKDVLAVFGADNAAALTHWQTYGQAENRRFDQFDPLAYLAANRDLIDAFGLDTHAATRHYVTFGWKENRPLNGFDPLSYIASDKYRLDTIGVSAVGGLIEYVGTGAKQGATTTFDGRAYIASYADLRSAFGLDKGAGLTHYLNFGVKEDREVTFDPSQYLATNTDLVRNFGDNIDLAYQHYFSFGAAEDRQIRFDAFDYLGSNPTLASIVGYDTNALTRHYLSTGFQQGLRTDRFDAVAYGVTNRITGDDWLDKSVRHYLNGGASDGNLALPFGSDQASHGLTVGGSRSDLLSTAADNDWFLFRGAAYTSYTITIAFQDAAPLSRTLASIRLLGQDGVTVIEDLAGSGTTTHRIYTQEAEDVYLILSGRAATPGAYTIAVSVNSAQTALASPALAAIPTPEVVGLIGQWGDDGGAYILF